MREMKEVLKRVGVLALSVMLAVGSSNLTTIAAETGANAAATGQTAAPAEPAAAPETPSAEQPAEAPEKGWNPVWIILLVGVMIIIGIGMMLVKNKEEK